MKMKLKVGDKMGLFCIIAFVVCFFKMLYELDDGGMHQLYGASYGIMATIFICTFIISSKLQKK